MKREKQKPQKAAQLSANALNRNTLYRAVAWSCDKIARTFLYLGAFIYMLFTVAGWFTLAFLTLCSVPFIAFEKSFRTCTDLRAEIKEVYKVAKLDLARTLKQGH